jgi:tape measure domain-containing protein
VATIDDKVVAISFESGKFEAGINKTIAALDKLKAALHFPTAGKGLDDINAAAKRVDLSHISRGVDAVKDSLNSLRIIGLAVLSDLAIKAVHAGASFVKAFTLDPAKAGFAEYATNLNAIQTILANTQAAGTNLKQVNAALKELNEYSDKTIYNFSQMARNIGTFTAAGVELDTATASIKGIANLAALSGSNAEQAATAMYQLSQAISAGSVKLQDWNSVVNAGMGGTVFQRALAQTAEVMGTLEKGAVKLEGPMKNVSIHGEAFRQSLSTPGKASWLTSDVLTKTLEQFTSDLSNAELAAMGFNNAQIKAIQQTAKTAMHAATEVKTLSQVLDVAKETAGSGWAQTWQIIFGDFAEAKKTFTGLSNTINGFINANADARNKVLADWKALGGRTVLIDSIKTAFHNLGLVLKPIKEAFRDIFPATTGRDLYNLTLRFQDFANALKPSEQTVENLKRTFRGLFALLDIGKQILTGLFGVFGRLLGVWGEGAGGVLNFTGNIGDFLVAVDEALKKGTKLNDFFEKLGDILQVPIEMLKTLTSVLVGLFAGSLPGNLASQMAGLGESMNPIQVFANNLAKTWNRMLVTFNDTLDALGPAFDAIISLIQGLGTAIGEAASNMNFEAILAVVRTGLLGGLVLMLKNFFGKGSLLEQISKGFGGGIIQNIAGSFKALEGSMVAMQQNIKAKTLKEIAIAIALLAASVLVISMIDPKKLNTSVAAIGIMMAELVGAMALLSKVGGAASFAKLPIMAAGLIALAAAIDLLTIAVFALSKLSWQELLKGLSGVGALLAGVSGASVILSANSAGMIRAGVGITAIAIAMNLLALAVKQFSGLSWGELVKGLAGVGGGLVVVAGAMKVMPKGMVLQGAALIALAAGLKILASAVAQFAAMNWGAIGKGLAAIGGALVVIALAMHVMPKGMVLQAAALLLVAVALGKIADAVAQMGGMSISQIAKGLGVLAGSLLILAVALNAMSGTLAGAAGLALAAVGITLIAAALSKLGGMSWGEIVKGLVGVGAALVIIGGVAVALSAASAPMLAFGAALLVIGAGLALAGAGIALIGVGLSAIAVSGTTAIGILVAALGQFQKALIENAKLLVLGLLEIVKAFSDVAPQFVDAIVKILGSLLDAIVQMAPKISEAFNALLDMALQTIAQNQGRIIQAGFDLIIALLQGVKNNIPALVTLIVDIITRIISTISSNLGRIIAAGLQLLVSFVRGIASGYAQVITAALDIVTKFLATITSNLGRIVTAGLTMLATLLKAIAGKIGDVIKMGVDIIVAFITGVGNALPRIVDAAVDAMTKFIQAIAKASVKLVDEGMRAIVYFLNGVATAIETHSGEMRAAGFRVGIAIIDGMTGGLVSKAGELYSKIEGIMSSAMSIMKKIPGISSPAKETMKIGQYIMDGLYKGISGNGKASITAAEEMSRLVIAKFAETFQTYSPSKVMYEIGQYVGEGFAQGLRDSKESINQVWKELDDKLLEAMRGARETIDSEQKKLSELQKAAKPNAEAIKEAQKVISENQVLLQRSTAGHKALTQELRDEKAELIGLVTQYHQISEKLKGAQEALATAKQTRADAIKGFTDQYATLPDIVKEDAEGNAVDQLKTYMDALKNQADAVAAYRSTLDQLRKLGLDDATYQKLLEEGTADQEFATALLAGGKTAVEGLNKLDTQLKTQAEKLAKHAGHDLYDAGVEAAQGLVKGLRSQMGELRAQAEAMADEINAAFRARLKLKSPSRVFMENGKQIMEGLAIGIVNSAKTVANAVDVAADAAMDAMKSSMQKMSDVVTSELNPNPTITPILDLTQVRAQAAELGALTNVTPITAAASYGQAALISAQQRAIQEEQVDSTPIGGSVVFEQNNYSPESLSEIEIYRQTKNQLSQLKSALLLS